MSDQKNRAQIERAKALLDLGAMRASVASGAHALVCGEGSMGVVSSSCAAILGLGFDIVDGFKPFADGEVRRNPAVLLVMFPSDPSRDDIRNLVLKTMSHAPGSILVVRARGRHVEDFALEMRGAHDEFLVVTSHF
jgi:hypothetical protein